METTSMETTSLETTSLETTSLETTSMETTFYSHSPICSYLKKKTCKETKQCPV
jgi:hypothetical protein